MRVRTFALLIILSLLCYALAATAQKAPRSLQLASAKSLEAQKAQFMDRVIELTNAERVKAGVAPLKREDSLTKSAQWLAQDMAANNYFAHEDRQGRRIVTRLPDFGYTGYSMIGENIAGGQQTPEQVVAEWMRSPGHRANLLNPEFCELGVAYVHVPNSELQNYWVQDFGTRHDVFPLIINNDMRQTNSPAIQLYAHGGKWAQQARYSSDGVSLDGVGNISADPRLEIGRRKRQADSIHRTERRQGNAPLRRHHRIDHHTARSSRLKIYNRRESAAETL